MIDFKDIINDTPIAGYEVNIDMQFDDPIVDFIGNIFEDMKDTKGTKDKKYRSLAKKLANGLTTRFGIPFKVNYSYDMFACMPIDQFNNVLISEMSDNKPNSKALLKKIEAFKEKSIEVDLKKVYIYGLEDVMHTDLYLDHSLITGGKLTTKELVAIQMHEVGHAFTYIYHSNKIVKNNVGLLESFLYTKEGLDTKGNKVLINTANVKSTDNKILIEAITKDNIKNLKGINNIVLGNKNNKDSESEADMFAVRFGLGTELGTALAKMLSLGNIFKSDVKTILFTAIIYSLLMVILVPFVTLSMLPTMVIYLSLNIIAMLFIFLPLFNILGNVVFEIGGVVDDGFPYLKLSDRIKKIKLEMIKVLRSQKLTKDDKHKLLTDIDNLTKTFNNLHLSKFENIISQLGDPLNYGKDINIEKVYNNIQNELQNNELHYLAEKANPDNIVTPGNEASIKEDYKYYSSYTLWSNSYFFKILDDKSLDKINEALIPYRINISIDKEDDNTLIIQSDIMYTFKDGITSLALLPLDKTMNVLTVGVDYFKNVYHILNKYIKVDNVIKVNIKKDYCVYIADEKRYDFSKVTNKEKHMRELQNIVKDIRYDYGDLPIAEELDMLINKINNDPKIKLPKEVMYQLELLLELVKQYNLSGVSGYDIHQGNFAYDNKTLIIMDPLFAPNTIGLKLNNCVELPAIKK